MLTCFLFFLLPLINEELTVYILYFSNRLISAGLYGTIYKILSPFRIFCCCFTRLKARDISQKNMKNKENIDHVVLGTVR